MKKITAIFLAIICIFAAAACGQVTMPEAYDPVATPTPMPKEVREEMKTIEKTEEIGITGSIMIEGVKLDTWSVNDVTSVKSDELANIIPDDYESDGKYYPVDSLKNLGLGIYKDTSGAEYYCFSAGKWTYPTGYKIPIILYLGCSDDEWPAAKVSQLDAEFSYLSEYYDPIWFEDLRNLDKYENPVIIFFKLGKENVYTNAFPIAKKYGVKFSVAPITGQIGKSGYLSERQIRELSESGLVAVEAGTTSNINLFQIGEANLKKEIVNPKSVITKITGKAPIALAYPEDSITQEDARAICSENYRFGISGIENTCFNTSKKKTVSVHTVEAVSGETVDQLAARITLALSR